MTDAVEHTGRIEEPDGGESRVGLAEAQARQFMAAEQPRYSRPRAAVVRRRGGLWMMDPGRPPGTGVGFHRSERTERLFVPDVSVRVTRRP